MYQRFLQFALVLSVAILTACGDSGDAVNKTVYIELPSSHFRGYSYAIGTVTEQKDDQYKIRIDEIIKGQDSDNELLNSMRLGRFVQMHADEVIESKDLPFVISKKRAQVVALNAVVLNALSLEQVAKEPLQLLRVATDGNGGSNDEISCVLGLVDLKDTTPIYKNFTLQMTTAAQGIKQVVSILKDYDHYEEARASFQYADSPDACVNMAVRLIREADFDLRRTVDAMRFSDMQQLEAMMQDIAAINYALLAFRTGEFSDIPHGQDQNGFVNDKLAMLTTDLRRYYAYNYFKDFRHDCDSIPSEGDVEARFQSDMASSKVLAGILGGPILDERTLNEYLNYYKLNKQLPNQISEDLNDDDYFQRASEGFSVVDPTDEQRLMGLEHYLQHFPDGKHVEQAQKDIEELKQRIQENRESMVLPPVLPTPETLRIEPPPEPEPIPAN
jgi:hypothetical protein